LTGLIVPQNGWAVNSVYAVTDIGADGLVLY